MSECEHDWSKWNRQVLSENTEKTYRSGIKQTEKIAISIFQERNCNKCGLIQQSELPFDNNVINTSQTTCWPFFHRWGKWKQNKNFVVQSRECSQCGKIQAEFI